MQSTIEIGSTSCRLDDDTDVTASSWQPLAPRQRRRQDLSPGGANNDIEITSHTRKITQNCVAKNHMYPFHFFFNKMKNKLILITVVRKIPKTFDMRDCLNTFMAPECGRKKINCCKSRAARVPMTHTAGDANAPHYS